MNPSPDLFEHADRRDRPAVQAKAASGWSGVAKRSQAELRRMTHDELRRNVGQASIAFEAACDQ